MKMKKKALKAIGILSVLALSLGACSSSSEKNNGNTGKADEESSAPTQSTSATNNEVLSYVEGFSGYALTADGAIQELRDDSVVGQVEAPGNIVKYSEGISDIVYLTKSGDLRAVGLFLLPHNDEKFVTLKTGLNPDDIVDLQVAGSVSVAYLEKNGDLYAMEKSISASSADLLPFEQLTHDDDNYKFVKVAEGVKQFSNEWRSLTYIKEDGFLYTYTEDNIETTGNIEHKLIDGVKDLRNIYLSAFILLEDGTSAFVGGDSPDENNLVFKNSAKIDSLISTKDINPLRNEYTYLLSGSDGLYITDDRTSFPGLFEEVGEYTAVGKDGDNTKSNTLFKVDVDAITKKTGAKNIIEISADRFNDKPQLVVFDENLEMYYIEAETMKVTKVGKRTLDNISEWLHKN